MGCVYTVQGDLFVNGDRIIMRQIPFNGGIMYGIDNVLRPPGEGGDCDVPMTLSSWVNNFVVSIINHYAIIVSCHRLIARGLVVLIAQGDTHQCPMAPLNRTVRYQKV